MLRNPIFKQKSIALKRDIFRESKIPNLNYRFMQEKDIQVCLDIYRVLEENEQLPAGYIDEYELYIKSNTGDRKFFVVESNSEVIATCGFIQEGYDTFHLIYGLIKPEFQRRGLGAIMFAIRAIELESSKGMIGLTPTDSSKIYYERYGFETFYFFGNEILKEDDEKVDINNDDCKRIMLISITKDDITFLRNYAKNCIRNNPPINLLRTNVF